MFLEILLQNKIKFKSFHINRSFILFFFYLSINLREKNGL